MKHFPSTESTEQLSRGYLTLNPCFVERALKSAFQYIRPHYSRGFRQCPDHTMAETEQTPSPFNYILSFLLVAICWGFTTPFIRKAAINYTAPSPATHPSLSPSKPWLSRKIALAFWTLVSLLTKPSYAVPLVANLTGSIWFFLLVGQAGKSTI